MDVVSVKYGGETMSADPDRNTAQEPSEDPEARELTPEDQARVDAFLQRGVNSVERKPFRPILLMVMLIVVVGGLSLLSQWIAKIAGVY